MDKAEHKSFQDPKRPASSRAAAPRSSTSAAGTSAGWSASPAGAGRIWRWPNDVKPIALAVAIDWPGAGSYAS